MTVRMGKRFGYVTARELKDLGVYVVRDQQRPLERLKLDEAEKHAAVLTRLRATRGDNSAPKPPA